MLFDSDVIRRDCRYLGLPSQTVFYFTYAVSLRNTTHNGAQRYGDVIGDVIRSLKNYEFKINNRLSRFWLMNCLYIIDTWAYRHRRLFILHAHCSLATMRTTRHI